MSDFDYDELDPGIRRVVRWLHANGFDTCDSGDGVSSLGLALYSVADVGSGSWDCPGDPQLEAL